MNPTLEQIAELPPWLRQLMFALIEKQLFEDEFRLIMQTQMRGDAPDEGPVPGRAGWTYQKGWNCWFLADQDARLSLELSTKSSRSTFGILGILGSVSRWRAAGPGPAAPSFGAAFERSAEWLPGPAAAVWHAVDDLVELGALDHTNEDEYQLADSLFGELESLDPQAISALFADVVEEQEQEQDSWRAWLERIASDPKHCALSELHRELDDDVAERVVWKFLQQPPGKATAVALDVASRRGMDIPDAVVVSLVGQTDALGDDWFPTTVLAIGTYALPRNIAREAVVDLLVEYASDAHEHKVDLAEGLDEDLRKMLRHQDTTSGGVHGLAEIAALLLEYAPDRAIGAIRRALREDPTQNLVVAGRLVAIGQPWAIREVVAAIGDLPEPMMRKLYIEVLRSHGYEEPARKAAAKESSTTTGLGFMDDLLEQALAGATAVMNDDSVRDALTEWADRIRGVLPDGFDPG